MSQHRYQEGAQEECAQNVLMCKGDSFVLQQASPIQSQRNQFLKNLLRFEQRKAQQKNRSNHQQSKNENKAEMKRQKKNNQALRHQVPKSITENKKINRKNQIEMRNFNSELKDNMKEWDEEQPSKKRIFCKREQQSEPISQISSIRFQPNEDPMAKWRKQVQQEEALKKNYYENGEYLQDISLAMEKVNQLTTGYYQYNQSKIKQNAFQNMKQSMEFNFYVQIQQLMRQVRFMQIFQKFGKGKILQKKDFLEIQEVCMQNIQNLQHLQSFNIKEEQSQPIQRIYYKVVRKQLQLNVKVQDQNNIHIFPLPKNQNECVKEQTNLNQKVSRHNNNNLNKVHQRNKDQIAKFQSQKNNLKLVQEKKNFQQQSYNFQIQGPLRRFNRQVRQQNSSISEQSEQSRQSGQSRQSEQSEQQEQSKQSRSWESYLLSQMNNIIYDHTQSLLDSTFNLRCNLQNQSQSIQVKIQQKEQQDQRNSLKKNEYQDDQEDLQRYKQYILNKINKQLEDVHSVQIQLPDEINQQNQKGNQIRSHIQKMMKQETDVKKQSTVQQLIIQLQPHIVQQKTSFNKKRKERDVKKEDYFKFERN